MNSKHIAVLLWGVIALVLCLFINVQIDMILRYIAAGLILGYLWEVLLQGYLDKKLPVWEARLEKIQQLKNESKK